MTHTAETDRRLAREVIDLHTNKPMPQQVTEALLVLQNFWATEDALKKYWQREARKARALLQSLKVKGNNSNLAANHDLAAHQRDCKQSACSRPDLTSLNQPLGRSH